MYNHMEMYGFFCWVMALLLVGVRTGSDNDKFAYSLNDTIIVFPNSHMQLSTSISTAADEYLNHGQIELDVQISQRNSTSKTYNILYFDFANSTGAGTEAYLMWVESNLIDESNTYPCTNINHSSPSGNYTGCSEQPISCSIRLVDQDYTQNLIVIQNANSQGVISFQTFMSMSLVSENNWFYWGVGLTCLLLIDLVIFTGVVLYWSLKYKKTKKIYEQFKLTQESLPKEE